MHSIILLNTFLHILIIYDNLFKCTGHLAGPNNFILQTIYFFLLMIHLSAIERLSYQKQLGQQQFIFY